MRLGLNNNQHTIRMTAMLASLRGRVFGNGTCLNEGSVGLCVRCDCVDQRAKPAGINPPAAELNIENLRVKCKTLMKGCTEGWP